MSESNPVGGVKCVLCGHKGPRENGICRYAINAALDASTRSGNVELCGCKCEFAVDKEAGEQREAFAKTAFDAVMAVESSDNNYSALQKAAQVAAMVRGSNADTSSVPVAEPACPHCSFRDCQCSDFDVSPDMGAK